MRLRQLHQRAAGVCDRDELLAGVAAETRLEVLGQRERLDRPAGLGRDDEDRVLEVELRLHVEDLGRVCGVEHVQVQRALRAAEAAAQHLRREARAAHAEQHGVLVTLRRQAVGEGHDVVGLLEQGLADGEPAEPIADLGNARAAPERLVATPHARRHVLLSGAFHPLRHGPLEVVRKRGHHRVRPPRDHRLAPLVDAAEQLLHRHRELVHAVLEELGGDVRHIDAGVGERGELSLHLGRIGVGRGAAYLAVLGEGQEGGHRHRVHRVRGHEPVHVHRVRVVRVLRAGGRPQRPLHERSGLAQGGEALAVEHLLEADVRRARVGQRGRALQLAVADRLEPLVHLGVHARDEEARDRMHVVDRPAVLAPALEPANERLGGLLVHLHGEQEGDVDVDALVDRLLDRRDALLGARDLDHRVGPPDQLPVLARLLERALGVVREPRRHLERHVAVKSAGALPYGTEHVGRERHVLHRELAVDLARLEVLARELGELLVVVRAAEDRLLEDRRVGGHAPQRLLAHHALELARVDQAAADLVEPDAHAGLREGGQPLVHTLRNAHLEAPLTFGLVRARLAPPRPPAVR